MGEIKVSLIPLKIRLRLFIHKKLFPKYNVSHLFTKSKRARPYRWC